MIFPILNGLLKFQRAPITWSLVFLNVLVLFIASVFDVASTRQINEVIKDKAFIEIQGAIYQHYLQDQPGHQIQRELASLIEGDTESNHQILGVLAFRDEDFFKTAFEDFTYSDEVALNYWRKKAESFQVGQERTLSYLMGVNSSNYSPLSWFAYMFAHGSWTHLLSNMMFLILMGGTLELTVGSFGVLVVYLLSGFIACGFYILLSGLSASPLIGASGAVSGLISFFAVLNWNRPVRFVYWLMVPRKEALGFVYFPGYILFLLWLIADFSGWLGSSNLFGGVAHSAHLGGHLAGATAGLGLILLHMYQRPLPSPVESVELYRLYPLRSQDPIGLKE